MKQVMYIAINKNLDGLIKNPGKIGAHTAHAVFDYLQDIYDSSKDLCDIDDEEKIDRYDDFLSEFKYGGDTIIVVKASEKDMLKWEAEGYTAVRDRGLTCVKENSLTAINLGIYDKDKGIPKWIQRLRLL